MGGGLGGIFASVAFKQTESPKYTVSSCQALPSPFLSGNLVGPMC